MLMAKTWTLCTIPIIDVTIMEKLYLPRDIHYAAFSCQKLGTGAKLEDNASVMNMLISSNPIMSTLN